LGRVLRARVVRMADVADLVRSRADSRVAVRGVFGGDWGWDSVDGGCFVTMCQLICINVQHLHGGGVSNVEVMF
jgi:hypothetical protein